MTAVSLASTYFDLRGDVQFRRVSQGASMNAGARRFTKYPLLAGGVADYDAGYHEGDERLSFSVEPVTGDQVERARRLATLYPEIRVTLPRGAFRAKVSNFEARDGRLDLQIDLLERISG